MKIKSRSLLTVILALLCAVALAIGISFALPKNENINARAATPDVSAKIANTSTIQSGNVSASNTDTTISLAETVLGTQLRTGTVSFNITVEVPAKTTYEVDFLFTLTVLRGGSASAGATTVSPASAEVSGGGGSVFVATSNTVPGAFAPTPGSGTITGIVFANSGETTATITSPATFQFTLTANAASSTKHQSSADLTMSVSDWRLSAPVAGSDTTGTYTGSPLNFKMYYDSNSVVPYDVEGIDPDGNSLTITTDAIDMTAGMFKPTLAGTYKVKFQLTSSVTWTDGSTTEKVLTFTVKRAGLTVPTVTGSPKTYDPNGCTFSVDTNYDALKMTASGVTSGITWEAASNYFKATTAGTYTVKFHLDDKNYEWSTQGGGTTTDQTATVKIEKQQLTKPTVTATKVYTGSALTFILSNFDSGTYIKMNGVTGVNGNVATGVGGAALTETSDTFEATNVGVYTVALSLRDTTNYAWTGGTSDPTTTTFEITKKEVLSAAPVSSKANGTGAAEWKYQDNTATITVTDSRKEGENLNLSFYYDNQSTPLTDYTTTGNVTVVKMPDNIQVGTHTFYVELNGTSGDNANYQLTQFGSLTFEVTSAKKDPSQYGWTYTKDGAAGSTIVGGGKVPFELKPNNTVDGVKYELSIKIPDADQSAVAVDTTKYTQGYDTRSGSAVGTYVTKVALKSLDPTFQFEVNGTMQDTCEVTLNWEIEKGTFNLSDVKWKYSLDGGLSWTDYDNDNPPQYNDGNYIIVKVKETTLPNGLTLDSMFNGVRERDVGNYTATISASDLVYNTANFKAPDTSEMTLLWKIEKKNLFTNFKNVQDNNENGACKIIIKQLNVPDDFKDYIDYKYYDQSTGLEVTLDEIKAVATPTTERLYKVEAYIKPAYASNYSVDNNGNTPTDQFRTGSQNLLATVTYDGADINTLQSVEYNGSTQFDRSLIKVTGDNGINITDFTVKYYKGTTPVAANELPAGELPKNAGDYCIEVVLGSTAEIGYILGNDRFAVKVEAKGIALPTLGEMVFNGNELNFVDYLSGSWNDYKSIISLDGKLSERNIGAGNYVTTLELTDTNYKWIYPSSVSPTKSTVKYSLAADGVSVTGDDTVATYNWNITPLIVDTTNMWNKGNKGATLNLPQTVRNLISAGTLEVGYRYYSEGQFVEQPELKSGRTFKVEAVFSGDDAERNVQFKRSETEFGSVSNDIDYTVPKSSSAAFFGKVKEFMTSTLLGLPVWAWFLIAIALIILLIVIIVVAKKRSKTKEEREAKKAAKEEEKARREEERRLQQERLEEERRLQREKLEAERELARAKQEAELEKIRAQAQAGMAGAGMATMAMQQPMQQAMPTHVVDNTNNELLKEMTRQMAELRADNKATQEKLAAMQTQQAPMAQAMPAPMMPQYQQYPMYHQPMMPQYGDPTLARLEAQLNAMQAEQRARYDAEQRIELAAMRAEQHVDRDSRHSVDLAAMREHFNGKVGYNNVSEYSQPNSIEALGAIVAAALKNMANDEVAATQVPELPQKTEQEAVAKYPSDAVITTTTTVDTTKNGAIRRSRDEEESFDIDGFYDPLD